MVRRCRAGAWDDELGQLAATDAPTGNGAAVAAAGQLQLPLAALSALFRLLHLLPDHAAALWDAGGAPFVRRVVQLAAARRESFEEAATKLLVVFFSHHDVQTAMRDAGVPPLVCAHTCIRGPGAPVARPVPQVHSQAGQPACAAPGLRTLALLASLPLSAYACAAAT